MILDRFRVTDRVAVVTGAGRGMGAVGVGRGVLQPVLAGVVTAVVGFASTFAVVLAS